MLGEYKKLQEDHIALQEQYGKLLEQETGYLKEGMKAVALRNYLMACAKNKEVPDLNMLKLIETQNFEENKILCNQFSDIIQD